MCVRVRGQASAKYFAMNERLTARLKIADNNKVGHVCARETEGEKEGRREEAKRWGGDAEAEAPSDRRAGCVWPRIA